MNLSQLKRRTVEWFVPPREPSMAAAQREKHTQMSFFLLLAAFVFAGTVVFGVLRAIEGSTSRLGANIALAALAALCWWWARRSGSAEGPMAALGIPTLLMLSWLTLRQGDAIPAAGWWLSILPFVFAGGGFYKMAALAMALFTAVVLFLFVGPALPIFGIEADVSVTRLSRFVSIMLSELLAVLFVATMVHRRRSALAALDAARNRAVDAAQAKSRFLANMSHEIRTPLNGVIGAAELLRSPRITEAQRLQLQALQEQSAQALLALVNDVLDYAKLEAGKMGVTLGPLFLRGLVFEANELFAVQGFNKGIEVSSSCDADVPATVIGDATRIRQVVNNLVSNAVKFTESGEVHIHLSIERRRPLSEGRRCIRIDVSDTGPGIAPAAIGRLFDAFTQADESINRRYGGTGLGLAISQELARLMGGELNVKSEIGTGSVFTLLLPLAVQPDADRPRRPAPRPDIVVAAGGDGLRRHLRSLCSELGVDPLIVDALPDPQALAECRILLIDAPLLAALADSQRWAEKQRASGRRLAILTPLGSDLLVGAPDGAVLLYKPVRGRALRDVFDAAEATRAEADTRLAPEPFAAGDLHVLVVEDNPVNQMVAQAMLAELGATCTIARDGREALQCAASERFDLVLMDIQMPVLDGFATTRALREAEAEAGPGHPRLTIVAMTANSEVDEKELCLRAGMDDFLSKPFGIANLRRCLLRWKGAAAS